jgi:hypothetical protein
MHYQCLLINDSGAVEFSDRFLYNVKPSANAVLRNAEKDFHVEPPVLEFEMYDDPEFNRINDILHAPKDFIINERTKEIFESFRLPEHRFGKAKVSRNDKKILFLKTRNEYPYHWLYFGESAWARLYEQIDFRSSDIEVYEAKTRCDIKIERLDDVYKLINSERSYTWKTNKIVLTKEFDSSIDLFQLPLFSWMTYVSDSLRNKLLEEKVSDIKFVDTGIKSRLEAVQNPLLIIN